MAPIHDRICVCARRESHFWHLLKSKSFKKSQQVPNLTSVEICQIRVQIGTRWRFVDKYSGKMAAFLATHTVPSCRSVHIPHRNATSTFCRGTPILGSEKTTFAAFPSVQPAHFLRRSTLKVTAVASAAPSTVKIITQGRHVEVTPALKSYVVSICKDEKCPIQLLRYPHESTGVIQDATSPGVVLIKPAQC